MPSRFARTLPNKRSSTTWAVVGLISVLAVLFVAYNYMSTTLSPIPQGKPIIVRPGASSIPDNLMRATVISTNGLIDLPNDVPFDKNAMYYSTAGLHSRPLFLLIHTDERGASSRDWHHLFEVLATQGTYYATDLINFGQSQPGPASQKRHIFTREHGEMLAQFIRTVFLKDESIILVVKGKGADIALTTAHLARDYIQGLVLIAPEVSDQLVQQVNDVPVFLVWAEEDPVVKFEKAHDVEQSFHDVTTLYFDHILHPGVSLVEAHSPEKIRLDNFALSLQEWTQYLDKYRR